MLTRRETCTCHCKRREFQRHPRPSDGPPLPRRADNTLQLHRSAITLLAVLEVHSLDVLEHGEHVSTLDSAAEQRARSRSARATNEKPGHTCQRAPQHAAESRCQFSRCESSPPRGGGGVTHQA